MKKGYTLLYLTLFFIVSVSGQTTGDFRSKAAGPANWNDFNAWERFDGSSWQSATSGQLPASTSAVEIQAGHSMVVNASGLASGNLTVNGSLTYHATTVSALTVSGNVTVNATGSLTSPSSGTVITHALSIAGNLTVDGTFNTNVFSTAGVVTTFTGASNNTISGTGTTINFYSLVVNKGTAITNILEVTSVITIVPPASDGIRLTITNGTFKLSSASSLSPYYGQQAICQAPGRLWINNASALVQRVGSGTSAVAGRPMLYGTLQIDAGTFAYGSGNDLFITQATIIMGGPSATMNIYGALSLSAGSKFTMSDGNINIYPQAAANYAGTVFYFETSFSLANTFTFTGGNITIVDPSTTSTSIAVNFTNSYPGNITYNMTGGTIRLGDGTSNKAGNVNGFQINSGGYPFGNIIVNNNPSSVLTTRIAKLSANSIINGNLTVNSGTANQFLLNSFSLTSTGNIINSGTFTGDGSASNTLIFNGTTQQVVSGTGTFTNGNINNITVNSSSVSVPSVDLQANLSVSNSLTLTKGTLGTTNASVFTIGRSVSSTSFTMNRSGGSLGLTPAFSLGGVTTAITYNYTAPTPAASTTTGTELPATITPTTLSINNISGVVLNNPVFCTTLSLASGILSATATNFVTVTGTGAGNVAGGSATAYVNGPLVRTIPNTSAAANYRFPVGKVSYELFEFASLTTGGTGSGTMTVEAFDAGPYTGTAGTGLASINTNKYWNLSASLGSVTINPSSTVRLTDAGLVTFNHVGQSDNSTGTYNSIGGIISGSTITSVGAFDQSTLAAGTYFRVGTAASFAAGTYAIGPSGPYLGYAGTFASVTAVTTALTNVPLAGNLIFEFQSDYLPSVETYPLSLTTNIYSSVTATILFRPAPGVSSLIDFSSTGNILSNTGADYISFDGRNGGTGTSQFLKFTSTSATLATVSIGNNSTNNSFTYCLFKGSATAASTGVFTTGTTLNSPLAIDHCDFDASGTANSCFYSVSGIPSLSVTNSNFFDFRNGYGILVATGSTNAIVDNNSIYQTTAYNSLAGTATGISFIGISGGQVSNNNIGGSGPGLAGTWTVNATAPAAYNFTGITATSITTSNVYNNKIQSIDWKCSTCTWTGISTGGTSGTVGTGGANYIGSGTGTENIKITSSAGVTQVNGITNIGIISIENNIIGSIRTFTTAANAGTSFTGISATGSAAGVINNNQIGSATTPLSINLAVQSATGNAQNAYGIFINAAGLINVTGNTIANVNNGSTVATGLTRGILNATSGGNLSITSNSIYSLITSQPVITTGSSASLDGINVQTNANPVSISGNTIYDLTNTSAGAAVIVNGITYASTTSINNKIEKNLIHSLKTVSNTSVQNGINITNGICTVQNNVIRLGIDKDGNPVTGTVQINGITKASATTGTFGFFFNTVFIGGSGVAAGSVNTKSFNLTSHTTEDIRNNIFVNVRTNAVASLIHYALWFPAGIVSSFTNDYNIYQISGTDGKLARFGTTDLTNMGALQVSLPGSDLHSGFGDPLLTSPAAGISTMDLKPLNNTPAEANGIAIGSVTDDFTGAARSGLTPTDIGAYAGNFTPAGAGQDIWFPVITYTKLLNTGVTTNRTTVGFATITDYFTGVNTTTGTLPRIYYKKTTDANAFAGNTSSDNGWKWVEANNASSPFDFTIDYSIINGGSVSIGDTIQYFVAAQDLATTPNVSFNPSNGASGTSVAPAGMVAPGVPNRYVIVPTIASAIDVGTGYTYTTLTGTLASGGLFAALNSGVINTNVVATIRTNTAEPGTVGLNTVTEEGPNAGTLTLTIQSDGSAHVLAGTVSPLTQPLILFNGASRVTVNGGSKLLTFRNANPTYNTTGPVMQFQNGSQNCTVTQSIFESNTYGPASGEITVGTTGVNSVTISNNDFRDNRGTTPGSQRCCIYSNSATNSLTITNNNLYNFKAGFSLDPPSYGINLPAVANGCIITGNSFYMETGQNPICPQLAISISGGNSHIITGNFIGGSGPGCTGTWNGTLSTYASTVGIYITGATAPASTIQGNTIQGLNLAGSGTFAAIQNNAGVANVVGNTIGSATVANAIQYSGTSSLIGLYNTSPTGVCNFDENTIANITFTGASGTTGMRAMMVSGGNVRKNKIYNIGSLNAAVSPTIYGIWNAAGLAPNEFSNNLIALNGGNSGNPALFGFYDISTIAGTYGFYFNSVNIYGTATGAAITYAYYRGNSAVYILKSNILANTRTGTGTHYAIFSNSSATLTSDYNDLYTSGAAFGSFGGVAKPNFASWQALPQDLNSVNVNPAFVTGTDLHTAVPQLNNGGQSVSGISSDLANVTRTVPPDIGAYEFTLPITAINTLAATSIGQTSAVLNGNINTTNEIVVMSFDYGQTIAYGTNVAATITPIRSLTLTSTNATASPLLPNTLYHYRIQGVSATSAETVYGLDMTFVTLPMPTITPSASPVCVHTPGIVYTTEAGNSNYVWVVSAGGTVTAGGGLTDNTVTVTWNAGGTQTVSVNYNNSAGFPAPSPTVYNVSFIAAPVPSLTGPIAVCEGTTGQVYTTDPLMTGYIWSATGGTIVAGGTPTDNTATIDWGAAGTGHVFVDYTGPTGCTALVPTDLPVTLNPLPVPVITGPTPICVNSAGNIYSTAAGMTGYSWVVSAGGTITSGGTATDNSVTVTWNTFGAETVSVSYTDGNGCIAAAPTVYPVTVKPILPVSVSIAAVPSGPVCSGTSVAFTATPVNEGTTPSYQWYNGAIPVGTDSPVFTSTTLLTGDVITVVLTSSEQCQSGGPATSNPITMTVRAPFTSGTAGSDQLICYATPATPISATAAAGGSGPYLYQWQSSPDGITAWADIIGETNLTYSPGVLFATSYYRIVSTDNGTPSCGSVNSNVVTITVNAPLTAPVVSTDQTICINTVPAQLSTTPASGGTGPFFYQWQMKTTGSWSNVGTGLLTFQPPALTQTTQYRVIASDLGVPYCGSAISNIVTVTVQSLPVAGTIAADQVICSGIAPAALTSTGAGSGSGTITYEWEYSTDGGTNWTLIPGANSAGYAPGILTQTTMYHRITVSTLNGVDCRSVPTAAVTITVNPLPTAAISGTATICSGGSTTLSIALTGTQPWSLTYTDGATPVTVNGITASPYTFNVSPATTSTYTVTSVTDATTCSNTGSGSAVITVNPLPTAIISGTATICAGNSTILSVALTGSQPWSITYTDGVTPVTVNGIASSPYTFSVSPASTTTYTVTAVTDANTCTNTGTGSAVVTVNPLPTASISGTATICAGSSTTLSVALTGSQPWSITYTDGTTPVTANGITASPYTFNVTPATTATYTVTNVTDATTCPNTGTGSAVVTVNPLPTATISGTATICNGGGTGLSVALTGSQPWSITYTDGITPVTVNGITVSPYAFSVSPVTTTTYTVTGVTDATTCSNTGSGSAVVTVNPLPTAAISGTATICSGSSTTLSIALTGSQPWNVTYTDGATPVTVSGITASPYTFIVSPASTTTYTVTNVTDANTCSNTGTGTAVVTVRAPLAAPAAGPGQTLCYGASAGLLTATAATGGSGPFLYQWQGSPDGLTGWADITGETALTYSPGILFVTSYYRITATDSGTPACGTVTSNVVTIAVNDPITGPVAGTSQTICNGDTPALLTATAATGGTGPFIYQWQMKTTGSWTNVGTNSLSYQPPALTQITFYQVIAIDGGNPYCGSAVSNMVTITVQAVVTAGTIAADQAICSGNAPAALTSTGAGTGSGTVTYEWEYSTDGGTIWTNIPGAFADGYAPGVLSQTTMYHRITVSTLNSVVCRSVPTTAVTITVNPSAVADFAAGNLFPPTNTDVVFTDLSTGTPVTWSWSFSPGTVVYVNSTSSTSQNPQVQFTTGGAYTVSLTVNGATCPNTMTKTAYIHAGIQGLWTGNASGVWNDPLNWDNGLVPDVNTDVVIPSAAANWPVFTGTLTVGTTCNSVSLTNVASQLTITGDLVILNGFSVTNSGNIILQGNLDNQNTAK